MKLLYLNTNTPDYLAESLFHGLRSLIGENCVDVPKYESMYSPLTEEKRNKLRGNGFTLYGLLPEMPSLETARNNWRKEIMQYDLVVISDIWKMFTLFREVIKTVPFHKIVVLDGHDNPSVFPFGAITHRLKKDPFSFFLPVHKVKYFKRELIGDGTAHSMEKIFPKAFRKHARLRDTLQPINFSIPHEKITEVHAGHKTKLFNKHIVDAEVAKAVAGSFFSSTGSDQHFFTQEKDYYEDLQRSRFGITTKRAGWDCLRHYELAANGCIVCFKDLGEKDALCAPHGLNESNSISYKNYTDLMEKIERMNNEQYVAMLERSYVWIHNNTTLKTAERFISTSLK